MIPNDQMQNPEVQIALAEIRTFAGQMQEMTALFARGQTGMARQMEATTTRLNKAIEAVAMGEARIVAQIASFERMNTEARRAIEHHAQIISATTGFSDTLETAVGAVDANARKIMDEQASAMASRVAEAMQAGEARLSSVTEALDNAAGALAHRIAAAAEAQDARIRSFEQLVTKCEQLSASNPDHESVPARFAQDQETSWRPADVSKPGSAAADKTTHALAEMQATTMDSAAAQRDSADKIGTLAGQQSDILNMLGGLTGLVDKLVVRNAEAPGESIAKILGRLDLLQNAIASLAAKAETASVPFDAPSATTTLDVEREAMKRLTIGYRLMMRDIAKENERLEQLVGTLASSIQILNEKAAAVSVPTAGLATETTRATPEVDATGLPLLDAEKSSLQRLTVGFRLLLQDISGEAGRLRESVDGVTALAARWPQLALNQRNGTPDPRMEQHMLSLCNALARLDSKLDELKPSDMALAVASVERNAAALPLFDGEKTSLQRVLAGFRLLLSDIGTQNEAYREKVAAIRQPETLVLSPVIEAELLTPLHQMAERIAEGVAETLSALERKLADPVASLTAAVADGSRMLTAAHSVMATAIEKPSPPPAGMTGHALADAVASMDRAAAGIDHRICSVDQMLAVLRKGGAVGSDQLRDIVHGMDSAANTLRAEAGDFLAIAAALSRDIEGVLAGLEPSSGARRHKTAQTLKKRTA